MTHATDGPAGHTCPACGWPGLELPPRPASYEVCPSCGFEFGVTDDDEGETYDSWRQKWLAQGAPWYSRFHPAPEGWDPAAQVAALEHPGRPGTAG